MAKLMYWISFIVFLTFPVLAVISGLEGLYQEMGVMIGLSIVWFALWRIWADLRELN